MPTVSFGNVKPTQEVAVVNQEPLPVGPVADVSPEGDWDNVSEALVELRLGQKTSKFAEENPMLMGKWVYDKSIQIGLPEDPKLYCPTLNRALKPDSVLAIVAKNQLFFEEKVDYGEGVIPMRWKTNAEARAAGVEYGEAATMDLLLPFTGEHEQVIIIDGKGFLKARFYAKKAAFRQVSQIVHRDERTWLKGDKLSGYYELTITKMQGAKGAYWVAGAKPAGAVPPELRDAIREKFSV